MAPKSPKTATKADEAAEGGVELGCSKCRFSAKGCARCRVKAGLDPLTPKKATPAKEKKTEACESALLHPDSSWPCIEDASLAILTVKVLVMAAIMEHKKYG